MRGERPVMEPAPADVILRPWDIKCADLHRQLVPKLQRYRGHVSVPAMRQRITPCPRTAESSIL